MSTQRSLLRSYRGWKSTSNIQNHHASWQETKDRAAALASEIESQVPIEAANRAKQRGERLPIDSLVKQFN
jgi:hypothetical protein